MRCRLLTVCMGVMSAAYAFVIPLQAKEISGSSDNIAWYSRLNYCLSKEGCKDTLHLYKNSDNPFIQSFNLTLRAQYQGAFVNSHQGEHPGSHHSTSEWRRLRLGWNATLLNAIRIVNVWNIGGVDGAGFYAEGKWNDHRQTVGNMFDLHLEYAFDGGKICLGKTLPLMMMEYRKPSSSYVLPELPALEEQLRADNSYGISFSAMDYCKDWGYYLGTWSDTERAYRKEWGTWQSAFVTSGISKNASGFLLEKGRVNLDWVYNFSDRLEQLQISSREAYVGTKARHVFALYYKGESGPLELNLEALAGVHLSAYKYDGVLQTPSDVIGLVVMPGYMITPNIQMMLRAQWSKGNGGVSLMRRYSCLVSTSGSYVDEYKAIAVGFNFFLFSENRNRMKIMAMLEYGNSHRQSSSGGFTGWTLVGGAYLDF